jgi:hypothetical protein
MATSARAHSVKESEAFGYPEAIQSHSGAGGCHSSSGGDGGLLRLLEAGGPGNCPVSVAWWDPDQRPILEAQNALPLLARYPALPALLAASHPTQRGLLASGHQG